MVLFYMYALKMPEGFKLSYNFTFIIIFQVFIMIQPFIATDLRRSFQYNSSLVYTYITIFFLVRKSIMYNFLRRWKLMLMHYPVEPEEKGR